MSNFVFYKQLDTMDCGPTCIRMIAKYYGRSYSLQYLRSASHLDREGTSLLNISQTAESIGFHTVGAKLNFQTLASDVPLPCIVHWRQNHFVIVYKIKSNHSFLSKWLGYKTRNYDNTKIYVADPSRGLITYSKDEFIKNWCDTQSENGISLLFETTPKFFEDPESSNLDASQQEIGFTQLFKHLFTNKYKALLLQLLLGLIIGSLLQLVLPFLTQSVVDIGINTHNISFIYLVLGAQLMLTAGRTTVDFIRSWILLHLSARINLAVLSEFLSKLMKLPLAFFDVKLFGDLMQRIGDQHRIEVFLTNTSLATLFSLLNLAIFGIVLYIYNLSIFYIFALGTVIYTIWVLIFLKRRRRLDFRRFEISAQNQGSLVQLIQGMQEIKLSNSEIKKRWDWEQIQVKLFKLNISALALNQYQQTGAFLINEGKNIFITFFAAQAVIRGELTLGAMLAVQYIVGQLNSPIEQIIGFMQSFQDAQISLERLNEIHRLDDEDSATGNLTELPELENLNINNIVFRYGDSNDRPILSNLSLTVPAGKITAIVGSSGSGKTTLLKLLLRFYDPTEGNIYLGDINLKNISHKIWRRQCGVVMQEGFIFSDTIAGNIAVGDDNPDYSRLQYAVRIANIQEYINSLPLGYKTKIGMEGNGMSQGQKQRILIARAVYKNPRFLFFDEATNALDANNEGKIMDNLNNFFEGRTVVIVAHRLSTVRNADQIIVLNKGEIVEIGKHEELISLKGLYHELVKNQIELSKQ